MMMSLKKLPGSFCSSSRRRRRRFPPPCRRSKHQPRCGARFFAATTGGGRRVDDEYNNNSLAFSTPMSSPPTTTTTTITLVLSNIFPDPSASAAGVRTQALLDGLAKRVSSSVHLATSVSPSDDDVEKETSSPKSPLPSSSSSSSSSSTSERNRKKTQQQQQQQSTANHPHSLAPREIIDDLARRNISWSWLPPNRSNLLQEFVQQQQQQQQQQQNVDKIVFDRFYIEEAYSFALREHYPDAALILDMQDMHSLRGAREKMVKDWDSLFSRRDSASSSSSGNDPFQVLEAVMSHVPSIEDPQSSSSSSSMLLLRELASIHRSDLTLVCSPYELDLLTSTYGISSSKLCLAPFFVPTHQIRPIQQPQPHADAEVPPPPSFVFCGGFKHAPNVDAVRLLVRYIWPQLRKALPNATLHIHGAYCPAEFQKAHNPSNTGIHVHGYTPSLDGVFAASPGSILLAPLRFGAGIKGKIIDAWTFGMPVVATPIGSEGMTTAANNESSSFGGGIAWSVDEFVHMAVELAVDKDAYMDAAQRGQDLLRTMQDHERNWERVQSSIEQTVVDLRSRRQKDYTRALLWHQSARSTEYFSRWIELKETTATSCKDRQP